MKTRSKHKPQNPNRIQPEEQDFSENLQKTEGLHVGKGPKGYRRSDTRIYEDLSEALTHHPGVDASEIEVAVKDAVVTLSGAIESRQMKKMAVECAEEIPGVRDVINELRIDTTYVSRSRT